MIIPNLATRPFLNTRPVWLVTVACAVLATVFVILNISFVVTSNRDYAPQIERREALTARKVVLERELTSQVAELDKVPWRSLAARVRATNVVLREHRFSWLQLLDDIERVMPYEVRLIRIGPAIGPEGVTLSLVVIARSRNAMLELLENLIGDPSFSEPIPIREGLPEESPTAGYDLSLRVIYHPPEEAS